MSPHPPDQPGDAFCPWCGATSPQSCRPDCARRQALAAYYGTPNIDGPPPPPPGTPLASDRNLIGRAEGDPFLPSGVSESRSVGETGCLGQANGSGETEKDPACGEGAFSGGKSAMPEKPNSPDEGVKTGFPDGKTAPEANQPPRRPWVELPRELLKPAMQEALAATDQVVVEFRATGVRLLVSGVEAARMRQSGQLA